MEGSLVLLAVADRGHSDGEVEAGDLPCVVVAACRRHQVRIQGVEGSPLGVRKLGVQGAGSRDHSGGEEVVCAWDWVATRLGGEGSHIQDGRRLEAGGGQRVCNQESPWVHGSQQE